MRLSSETIAYFKSFPSLLDGDNSNEDLSLIINNVYIEVKGREVPLSLHTETSRVIEKIIQASSVDQLKGFLENCSER